MLLFETRVIDARFVAAPLTPAMVMLDAVNGAAPLMRAGDNGDYARAAQRLRRERRRPRDTRSPRRRRFH
jgi:hypothetical protein